MNELPFYVDRAKGGRAACRGCKQKCEDKQLRIAKVVPSPYSDGSFMKNWYHVDCLMTVFLKQRPTTPRIYSFEDIGNWDNISKEDQDFILEKISETEILLVEKYGDKLVQKKPEAKPNNVSKIEEENELEPSKSVTMFKDFRKLCLNLMENSAYTAKSNIVREKLCSKNFEGDVILWCRLLLPGAIKRVYNLQDRQLVKLFSRILHTDHDDMITDLENGDVAQTIKDFHEKSTHTKPVDKSTLTVEEVDLFLDQLATMTKEDEQTFHFKNIVKKCTSNDLKMIIRLVKGDLKINAGPKHILDGIHPDAYDLFKVSRDVEAVLKRVLSNSKNQLKAQLNLMTPVQPMLAEACTSIEMAFRKCPNGILSEIKYDGERVQLHKQGQEFKYFSRALKPVVPHKISRFKDFIPKAFPHGKDLILDAEILMVDTQTGKPLPFGTLGIHKKSEFKDAEVCLFIFDCIYYNGEVLLDKTMRERRKILDENMVEVKNHVMFSEMKIIETTEQLTDMIADVLEQGLEGLVLKDLESKYEPGKRHWLKMKKDYLFSGAMADSADLVVLGAWFGSGKKGGMLSVFLMGCYDKFKDKWLTVTKVHTGHDDKTLEGLQDGLKENMIKISQDSNRVPNWLNCTKTMIPDYVAKDPKNQPVWEITGTQFTKAQIHTADGISVRFPRVTRIRDDKDWKTATNLEELRILFENSSTADVSLLKNLVQSSKSPSKESKKTNVSSKKTVEAKKRHGDEDIEGDKPVKKQRSLEFYSSDVQLRPKNPLPDVFDGYGIALFSPKENHTKHSIDKYLRNWKAFKGKVINDEENYDEVTHVIHYNSEVKQSNLKDSDKKFPFSARHVTFDWLKSSVSQRKILDINKFSVILT